MLVLCDFVWVQFYNTPACDIGSSGFNQTFKTWSYQLGSGKTKLYLGAPAWPGAVSQGDSYQAIGSGPGMKGLSQKLTAMNLCNFGGLMFWDGAEGILNQDEGRDIISWGKAGLMESASDVR
jgi:chitinase